ALALLHSGFWMAVAILVFLGVLRVVQDYVIYPRIIGVGIHLHPLAVILAILAGAELAGVAGIFLAIPVVAILTVSYRHWLEHRGSEGLADLLEAEPAETVEITESISAGDASAGKTTGSPTHSSHPGVDTTPEEMARERPDLTTGELKMPLED